MAGLTPKEILEISEPIEAIYQRTSDELLINIAHHFNISGWERTRYWEIKKLSEMGALTKESAAIIAKNTKMVPAEIEKAFLQVSEKACLDIDHQLKDAASKGLLQNPDNTPSTSILMRNMVQSYVDQAVDKTNMVNTTMLESTRQAYLQGITTAVNEAMLQEAKETLEVGAFSVATGVETRTMAIRKAMNNIANTGITGFYDSRGRKWQADTYAAMVIRTTSHNAAIESIKTRQQEYGGGDIFQVSSHPAARPLCYPYQGEFFSWSGSGEFTDGAGHRHQYKDINDSSYGQAAGLFGINCGHHPIPMIPNYSYPQDGPSQSEAENKKEYEESQKQRAYEREIREAKRDLEVAKATGDTEAVKAAEQKVAQKQANMRAYTKETGRPRRYDREQIAGSPIPQGYTGFRAQGDSDLPLANRLFGRYTKEEMGSPRDRVNALMDTRKYADNVSLSHTPLTNIKTLNKTLDGLSRKYPITKYEEIKDSLRMRAKGRGNYKVMQLSARKVKKAAYENERLAAQKSIDKLVKKYGDNIPAKYIPKMEAWKETLKYSRWSASEEYGFKAIVTHEYGHTLADQYFGMRNGIKANPNANLKEAVRRRALVRRTYNDAVKNGDIYKLTAYASKNEREFLAEAFTLREMGEKIPSYIDNMLNEVLKNAV